MEDIIGIIILSAGVFAGVYVLASLDPELNAIGMASVITSLFIILAIITKRRM